MELKHHKLGLRNNNRSASNKQLDSSKNTIENMDLTNIIGNLRQKRRRYSACPKINWNSRPKQLGCTVTSKKSGSDRQTV